MNSLFHAFIAEHGTPPRHYTGYYEKKDTWQSDLTEWISNQGYPCQAWCQRKNSNVEQLLGKYLPMGIELENSKGLFFLMRLL